MKQNQNIESIRDAILKAWLPNVSAHGWRWSDGPEAARKAGYQDGMAEAVFPGGIADVACHFSDWTDRMMMHRLHSVPLDALRTRDRIKTAVLARFFVLSEHRDILKASMAFWAVPVRLLQGQQILWRTADRIWLWAGDQSQDYNRHTKRGLLASILMATALVWVDDTSEGRTVTQAFLDRRIENIMEVGKIVGNMRTVREVVRRRPGS